MTDRSQRTVELEQAEAWLMAFTWWNTSWSIIFFFCKSSICDRLVGVCLTKILCLSHSFLISPDTFRWQSQQGFSHRRVLEIPHLSDHKITNLRILVLWKSETLILSKMTEKGLFRNIHHGNMGLNIHFVNTHLTRISWFFSPFYLHLCSFPNQNVKIIIKMRRRNIKCKGQWFLCQS